MYAIVAAILRAIWTTNFWAQWVPNKALFKRNLYCVLVTDYYLCLKMDTFDTLKTHQMINSLPAILKLF